VAEIPPFTDPLAEVLERLERRGERPDALIGISLGGNLLLKYRGEASRAARTRTAIAISAPFRLATNAYPPTSISSCRLESRLRALSVHLAELV
jgi:predicted alpha/beta-fold hydrolase